MDGADQAHESRDREREIARLIAESRALIANARKVRLNARIAVERAKSFLAALEEEESRTRRDA